MKNILLPISYIILLCSCVNNKSNETISVSNIYTDQVNQLIQERNKCKITDTTFILGVKAGMSETEVKQILPYPSINELGDLYYYTTIKFSKIGECRCKIFPFFYKDHLYKVKVDIFPVKNVYSKVSWGYIKRDFVQKYGTEYYSSTDIEEKECRFILKNKEIEIYGNSNNVTIIYSDVYFSSLNNKEQKKGKEKTNVIL